MICEVVHEFVLEKVENQTQQKQKENDWEHFHSTECFLL